MYYAKQNESENDKYHDFIHVEFKKQSTWTYGEGGKIRRERETNHKNKLRVDGGR